MLQCVCFSLVLLLSLLLSLSRSPSLFSLSLACPSVYATVINFMSSPQGTVNSLPSFSFLSAAPDLPFRPARTLFVCHLFSHCIFFLSLSVSIGELSARMVCAAQSCSACAETATWLACTRCQAQCRGESLSLPLSPILSHTSNAMRYHNERCPGVKTERYSWSCLYYMALSASKLSRDNGQLLSG